MLNRIKNKRAVSAATIAITTIAVLLGSVGNAFAQQPKRMLAPATSQPGIHLGELEDAFWVCDYVATTRGGSDIPTCTAVYEALKDRKFAGDFDALVSWWRQNKAAQHQILARADSASHW